MTVNNRVERTAFQTSKEIKNMLKNKYKLKKTADDQGEENHLIKLFRAQYGN